MINCEIIFPSIYKDTRNATPRLSSATPRWLTHQKSPTKKRAITISFTLVTYNTKCTCENRQSFSKRFFDGDIPHILLLTACLRFSGKSRKPFRDVTFVNAL